MADGYTHLYSGFWARQILTEFQNICWQYRLDLVPPVIEITDNSSRIGSWQPETRTIRISAELIISHRWDTTINVLKHEIAHQICSEIFNNNLIGHNEQFCKACDMIGLAGEYRRAGGSLENSSDDLVDVPGNSKGRQMISRVHKLLALAGSCNNHEASLAMRKANEMIIRYNLNILENDEERNYTYSVINLNKKQIKTYQRQICAILTDFFFVQVIISKTYNPLKNSSSKTFEILGTTENVAIAEHCYHFLENRLETLWKKRKHRFTANGLTEKNSFYMGVLKGFREKLDTEESARQGSLPAVNISTSIKSLMALGDKKLNEYVATRFPKLRNISGRGTRVYKSTFKEGFKAGGKITLHKSVSSQEGYLGNHLT